MSLDLVPDVPASEAQATRDEAEARAVRIRDRMATVADFWTDVIAAYRARDWSALGYASWDAYLAGEFGEDRVRLSLEARRGIMEAMRAEGMSTRAIGTAVGVGKSTVDRDIRESRPTVQNGTVEQRPAIVVSLDGRRRPATRPRQQPQPADAPTKPSADTAASKAARSAGRDLHKAMERVERVMWEMETGVADPVTSAVLRAELKYAVEKGAELLARLQERPENLRPIEEPAPEIIDAHRCQHCEIHCPSGWKNRRSE